jgi:predicted AAA+ superfamily ATPase
MTKGRPYFTRHLEGPLRSAVSRHKIRLLFGARQSGKTELLRHLHPGPGVHVVNLVETETRRAYEAQPGRFAREIRALPRRQRIVVVDEIQKVPSLLDEIQGLYDERPERWEFFLTGSSARRLRTRSANLLPGRSHEFFLYPVCAWEWAALGTRRFVASPPRTRNASAGSGFPKSDLTRELLFGALPGVRQERPATARATLGAYVSSYLEEEIRREALVRDLGPFSVFLRLAAADSGAQTNLAKLSQACGVPASSLKNYYQTLVDTFVGTWVMPYARRVRARLLTTPRFYFFDLGVRNAATELPLQPSVLNELGGRLLEHWVAQELIARAGYLGRGTRVSFWRKASGAEVDFIWESPSEDVPIEVKWTTNPRPSDARHVETFLDEHPTRAKRGIVVCRCEAAQELTKRVRAIPWDEL